MIIINDDLQTKTDEIISNLGSSSFIKTKNFYIGKNSKLDAVIVYKNNMVDKQIINRDILNPLMLQTDESICKIRDKAEYLCDRYITSSVTVIEHDIQKICAAIRNGNTILLLSNEDKYIEIDTHGGKYRQISDPLNETSIRGPRDSFVENIDTNISMIDRNLKDKNLIIENFIVGRRSQTRVVLIFIDDIADKDIFNDLKRRINALDVDFISAPGMLEQLLEENTYSPFPQVYNTERPDRIIANIMEGKIAILVDGNRTVLTTPTTLPEFFSTVEDYYSRTLTSSVTRLLRYLAVLIVLFFPSIYLVLLKFNSELIPVQFIVPIVQSRTGISLSPFMEIFTLIVFIELLREGGLRLPTKIAQTLSIVGGIIIGDAAVKSNMVSPTTLLVVGITVIASFSIPNYEMSLTMRLAKMTILIMANFTGILGISVGLILLITHLSSLESFGVPYLTFYKKDMKDIFVRAPLPQMATRPASTPNKNTNRQKDNKADEEK